MASVSGLMGSTRERIKIFQWVGKIEAIVMSRHIRHVFQKTNVVQKTNIP